VYDIVRGIPYTAYLHYQRKLCRLRACHLESLCKSALNLGTSHGAFCHLRRTSASYHVILYIHHGATGSTPASLQGTSGRNASASGTNMKLSRRPSPAQTDKGRRGTIPSHPITPHTSHLTPHTSHLTPHTSHLTPHLTSLRDAPDARERDFAARIPGSRLTHDLAGRHPRVERVQVTQGTAKHP